MGRENGGSADVEKLRRLLRIPTVSHADEAATDPAPFEEFVAALAESFPLLHGRLKLHRVREHSLLFHWDVGSGSEPVVLMAHFDVVPVDESAPWRHPPFGAEIHDGAIWGRGTLDDKGSLVGICAAVEGLLARDVVPARDIWLSFGAREEVSGPDAAAAVEELRRHVVTPWFVLDEGGAIAHEAFPGVKPPLGVIGVSEKGTTTIELRAEGRGVTRRRLPRTARPRGSPVPSYVLRSGSSRRGSPKRHSRCSRRSRRTPRLHCGRSSPTRGDCSRC